MPRRKRRPGPRPPDRSHAPWRPRLGYTRRGVTRARSRLRFLSRLDPRGRPGARLHVLLCGARDAVWVGRNYDWTSRTHSFSSTRAGLEKFANRDPIRAPELDRAPRKRDLQPVRARLPVRGDEREGARGRSSVARRHRIPTRGREDGARHRAVGPVPARHRGIGRRGRGQPRRVAGPGRSRDPFLRRATGMGAQLRSSSWMGRRSCTAVAGRCRIPRYEPHVRRVARVPPRSRATGRS